MKKTAEVCLCPKGKAVHPGYFLNVPACLCTEIDTPQKYRKLTSALQPKQIQCLSLVTVTLMLATQTHGGTGVLSAEQTVEDLKSAE